MSGRPSEAQLAKVERELRKAPRGTQRAVGGGIYMRLDGEGRRRFQFRLRQTHGKASQPARTFDTWESAKRERDARVQATKISVGPSRSDAREMSFSEYASQHYWKDVVRSLDALTRIQYGRVLSKDVVPFWGRFRLEQIEVSIFLMDDYREWLRKEKTTWTRRVEGKRVVSTLHEIEASEKLGREFAEWREKCGRVAADGEDEQETSPVAPASGDGARLHFATAAADRALNLTALVLDHARGRNILNWNPARGARRFHNKRELRGMFSGTHMPVLATDVLHPREIVRIAAAVPANGSPARLEERRGLVEVLGFLGLRPNEALALTHDDWRDEQGPRRFIKVRGSLKALGPKVILGQAKTGVRDVYLFPAIAEQLERIYQAQGAPPLDSLVFPNSKGGFIDLNNWRTQVWYPTLKRAGFISEEHEAKPKVPGSFHPYRLRHSCATLMPCATRPEEVGGGQFQSAEVARQLGHTVGTFEGVYAGILKDLHGVAGLTMDEIIRAARREIWGPLPGDPDFEDVELNTREAAELTGLSIKALNARIAGGSLPARKECGKYLISRHVLSWHGLINLNKTEGGRTKRPTLTRRS